MEKSKYAENLVLKGGLFIYSLTDFDSRVTVDVDGTTLTEALSKTFENRGHHFSAEQFEQVMAFGSNDAMQKKWKAFCRKIDTKIDDYEAVLRTIKAFLAEPYRTIMEETAFHLNWSAEKQSWL